MNKPLSWIIAILMVVVTISVGARAEPKIFNYNFTTTITRGDLINTTVCLGNGTNASGPSFYQAGNVTFFNNDFNFSYNAGLDTQVTKFVQTIREVDINCQTDNLLSQLVNTTQAVANSSIRTQTTTQDILLLYNGSTYYLEKWTECKEVNGKISERELFLKEKIDVCTSTLTNQTGDYKQCQLDLTTREKDVSNCQTQVQTAQKELTTCRTDLEKKSGYGQYFFAAAAGAVACWWFMKNKKNAPPDTLEFPQG